MKKLIFILILPLMFYNCGTEDIDPSSLIPEKYELNSVNLKDAGFNISNVNNKVKESTKSLNTEESEANGHFNSLEGHWEISFSSGEDGEFGNFVIHGLINVKGDIICTVVDGNRAVIQVVITKVGDILEGQEEIFYVGNTLFYLLEDNGEGVNAPSDRYWKYLLYADETWDFCFELDPDFFIELFTYPGFPEDGEFLDTGKESDQIQIR